MGTRKFLKTMKLLYIYRNSDLGYSISKVFRPIEEEMKNYADVDSIYLPVSNYSFKGLWENIKYVQKHCKNKKYDIIHITGTEHYLLPFLLGYKVVVTVHDLGRLSSLKGLLRWRYWLMQVAVLKFANSVTCISSKTFHEVLQNISIKKGRMIVIPNGVDDIFTYSPKEFNSQRPIILHIGVGPNKNLARSVMALQSVNCKLRIVGKVSGPDVELLQSHKIDYSIVYDLSDDEIVQEYKNADIINFPSNYEGFGMPIIEGQAIGRLVITSDMEPMKTVAGNGAILCNPYDVESIRSAYLKAINDSNYREDIIKVGTENVENYRLEYITEKYVNLYRSL